VVIVLVGLSLAKYPAWSLSDGLKLKMRSAVRLSREGKSYWRPGDGGEFAYHRPHPNHITAPAASEQPKTGDALFKQ
jgi:hypothetical protein